MIPRLVWKVTIASKRRGNWRPKVTLSLRCQVRQGELDWRPFVPQIAFVAQPLINRLTVEAAFTVGALTVYRLKENYNCYAACPYCGLGSHSLEKETLLVPLPDFIYSSGQKGQGDRLNGLFIVHSADHMSPYEGDISNLEFSFVGYLPWRPGEKPDYSDFLAAFSILPELFGVLWQEGLDSGVNEPLEFLFNGCPNQERQPLEQPDKPESLSEVVFV